MLSQDSDVPVIKRLKLNFSSSSAADQAWSIVNPTELNAQLPDELSDVTESPNSDSFGNTNGSYMDSYMPNNSLTSFNTTYNIHATSSATNNNASSTLTISNGKQVTNSYEYYQQNQNFIQPQHNSAGIFAESFRTVSSAANSKLVTNGVGSDNSNIEFNSNSNIASYACNNIVINNTSHVTHAYPPNVIILPESQHQPPLNNNYSNLINETSTVTVKEDDKDLLNNESLVHQGLWSRTTQGQDETKRRLIQQQLVLLLHAHKCKKREESNNNFLETSSIGSAENLDHNVCSIPHCKTMKNIIVHMVDCRLGKFCKTAHCASSQQILHHWKICNNMNCSVCSPLKLICEKKSTAASTSTTALANNFIISSNSHTHTFPSATSSFITSDNSLSYGSLIANERTSNTSNVLVCTAATLSQQSSSSLSPVTVNKTQVLNHLQQLHHQLQKQHEMQQQQQLLLQQQQPQPVAPVTKAQDSKQDYNDSFGEQHQQQFFIQVSKEQDLKQDTNNFCNEQLLGDHSQQQESVQSLPRESLPSCQSKNTPLMNGNAPNQTDTPRSADWRENVTSNLRSILIHKLVKAIFPQCNEMSLKDRRLLSLMHYATKVESDMFDIALNMNDYLQLLAVKTSKIQKDLDEKRSKQLSDGHNVEEATLKSSSSASLLSVSCTFPSDVTGKPSSFPSVTSTVKPSLASLAYSVSSVSTHLTHATMTATTTSTSQLFHQAESNGSSMDVEFGGPPCTYMLQPNEFTGDSSDNSPELLYATNMMNTQDNNISSQIIHKTSNSKPLLLANESSSENFNHNTSALVKMGNKNNSSILFADLSAVKNESNDIDNKLEVKLKNEDKNGTLVKSTSPTDVKDGLDYTKKVLTGTELRCILMPVLEQLYRCEPESFPFRKPVDPLGEGIPDYFDVIKKPMDLSTIKKKLDAGFYSDPWVFIDDVWQMFENAWTYNKKGTKVHKYSTKLSEIFDHEIDNMMKSLGYCCGHKHIFSPIVLICYGKHMCTIPVNTYYYTYQNRFSYCEKCFNDIRTDYIELNEDASQAPTRLLKTLFLKMKNGEFDYEPLVACSICNNKHHNICVMHMDQISSSNRFVCSICTKSQNLKKKENKFTAKREYYICKILGLPQTKLGSYLELRVNSFLKRKDAGMRRKFCNDESKEMEKSFPYIAKAIFAFMDVDGVDVCFFGMHVQEYASSVQPNSRRVYLAYMDSVNFFRPKHLRTSVYHELLIGYLDYAKNLGYMYAHIWACPPSDGDDYIFNCHPPDMKIPKPKRLQEWYKKMLNKAVNDQVIHDYKDLLKDVIEKNLQSVTEIPYFEGDYWPNVLEECIKELDEEEKKRKALEEADEDDMADDDTNDEHGLRRKGQKGPSSSSLSNKGSNNSNGNLHGTGGAALKRKQTKHKHGPQRKGGKKDSQLTTVCSLTARLLIAIEKLKEGFFVVTLQDPDKVTVNSLHPIKDPDQLVLNDLMDGRDSFLALAREKHYEFSSLRRAKYSTMAMLYELHTQGKDNFVYTCNICKAAVETHYHCEVCNDFDLCVPCYQQEGHHHKMEKLGGFDLNENQLSNSTSSTDQEGPRDVRKVAIDRCITALVHACQCRDANCRLNSCYKMKRIMNHMKICKRKNNRGCSICRQLIALCCYHAKHCQENKCLVPLCAPIKQKLQLQKSVQAQMMRRRMAALTQSGTENDSNVDNANESNGYMESENNKMDVDEERYDQYVQNGQDRSKLGLLCGQSLKLSSLNTNDNEIIYNQKMMVQSNSISAPLSSTSALPTTSSSSTTVTFTSRSSQPVIISLHSSLTNLSTTKPSTSNLKRGFQCISTTSSLLSQLVASPISNSSAGHLQVNNSNSNSLLTTLLANKNDDDVMSTTFHQNYSSSQNMLSALLSSPLNNGISNNNDNSLNERLKYINAANQFNDSSLNVNNDNINNISHISYSEDNNNINNNNNNLINNSINNNFTYITNNNNSSNSNIDSSNNNNLLNVGNLSNSLLLINTGDGYKILTNAFNQQLDNSSIALANDINNKKLSIISNSNCANNNSCNNNNDVVNVNNSYIDLLNYNNVNTPKNNLINVNGIKLIDDEATGQPKVFLQTILPTNSNVLLSQQSDSTCSQMQHLIEQQSLQFLQQQKSQAADHHQQQLFKAQQVLQISQQFSRDELCKTDNLLITPVQQLLQNQPQQPQQQQQVYELHESVKQCVLQKQMNQKNSQQIIKFVSSNVIPNQVQQLATNKLEKSIKQSPQQQASSEMTNFSVSTLQSQSTTTSAGAMVSEYLPTTSIPKAGGLLTNLQKLLSTNPSQKYQRFLKMVKSDPIKMASFIKQKQLALQQLQQQNLKVASSSSVSSALMPSLSSPETTSLTDASTPQVPLQQVAIIGQQQQLQLQNNKSQIHIVKLPQQSQQQQQQQPQQQQLQLQQPQQQQQQQVAPIMVALRPQESNKLTKQPTPVSFALMISESALLSQPAQTYINTVDVLSKPKPQFQQQRKQQPNEQQSNDQQQQHKQQDHQKTPNFNIGSATIHINNLIAFDNNININNTFNVTNNVNSTSGNNTTNNSPNSHYQTSPAANMFKHKFGNNMPQLTGPKTVTSQGRVSTNSQETLNALVSLLASNNKTTLTLPSTASSSPSPSSSVNNTLSALNDVSPAAQLVQKQQQSQKMLLNISSDSLSQPQQQLQQQQQPQKVFFNISSDQQHSQKIFLNISSDQQLQQQQLLQQPQKFFLNISSDQQLQQLQQPQKVFFNVSSDSLSHQQQQQQLQQPQKMFFNISSDSLPHQKHLPQRLQQQKIILQSGAQQLQNVNLLLANVDPHNQEQQSQQQLKIVNINQLSNKALQNIQLLNQQQLQQDRLLSSGQQQQQAQQFPKQFLLFQPSQNNNTSINNLPTSLTVATLDGIGIPEKAFLFYHA
ncbi:hypothetical protein HELRODRAFT_168416 [Helobdella robusta]|uniref:histone acetyltransferase n=1 Tax=Helobdella robusta TaxID=6412 RepID=T1F0K3_HELRO|nr:hypothetical protein HELRODRAFT_168416 [Helobdella robusta]ESO09433.1 hypothetical protein HELRODRAFT_168416 [Helobdella robusta]